jgi:DNA modification methylase
MTYCGDCLAILPTLGRVDACVTDPPYGMSYQSNYRTDRWGKIAGDEGTELLYSLCTLNPEHSSYIFCRYENLLKGLPAPKSVIVWVKNNWSMGDLKHEHGRQTELIIYYPGRNHYWPKNRPTDVIHSVRTGNNDHPTEKPTDLMEQIVSWTAGTVVDPCMGSGTTGVAAAKLGRKFIGIEIDPNYFEIACKRIEEAYKQPDLFVEQPKEKAEQLKINV